MFELVCWIADPFGVHTMLNDGEVMALKTDKMCVNTTSLHAVGLSYAGFLVLQSASLTSCFF